LGREREPSKAPRTKKKKSRPITWKAPGSQQSSTSHPRWGKNQKRMGVPSGPSVEAAGDILPPTDQTNSISHGHEKKDLRPRINAKKATPGCLEKRQRHPLKIKILHTKIDCEIGALGKNHNDRPATELLLTTKNRQKTARDQLHLTPKGAKRSIEVWKNVLNGREETVEIARRKNEVLGRGKFDWTREEGGGSGGGRKKLNGVGSRE